MTRWALLAALVLSTSGCYTMTVRASEINPDPYAKATFIKSFHTQLMVHHVVFGIVTLNNPEVQEIIAREVKGAGGKGARNLKLTHQHSFLDGLLGAITYNLYHPTTVIIDGDIVK